MKLARILAAVVFVGLGVLWTACQSPGDPPVSTPTATSVPIATATPEPTRTPTGIASPTASVRQPTPTLSPIPSVTIPLGNLPPPPFPSVPPPSPTPETPSVLEVPETDGPVLAQVMPSRDHFPVHMNIGDVEAGGYNTVPPTSGRHWDAWSDCGFYNYPLPDELLVHNLEHGNIIVSYNLDDESEITALRAAVDAIPLAAEYAIVRRYEQIPQGMVALTTWGVLDRMIGVDAERIAHFFRDFPGNTGPEFPNGLPCTTGVRMTDSSGG